MQLESGEVLKAGIDGTVNEIRFGEGDWIWPNVSLIQICDLTHLQAALSVDEYDIANVSIGEPCQVTIVPLGLSFETEIAHVDRVSTASGSVAYYSVTAEVTVPENVLPGMTASVSIPARSVHDVVTLDMAALSFEADDSPYVLVKEGETYVKQPVETGLSDGMKIEILSGLSEGDVVYRVSGTEKAVKALSLADVYKRIAGETVVIRDRSGSARGGMPAGTPEGFSFPGGGEAPEGFTPPEGFSFPGGGEAPEGFTPPEGFSFPEGANASEAPKAPEAEASSRPNAQPEKEEQP